MLRVTLQNLKKKKGPLATGLVSKPVFYRRIAKQGTKRTWERPTDVTEGTLDIAPNFDVLDVAENPSILDPSSADHNPNIPIPPPAPLAMPSDYSVFHSKMRALRDPTTRSAVEGHSSYGRGGKSSARADLMRQLNRNEVTIDSIRAADRQMQREAMENALFHGKAPASGASEGMANEEEGTSLAAPNQNGALTVDGEELSPPPYAAGGGGLTPMGDAVMAASLDASQNYASLHTTSNTAAPIATIPMGKQLRIDVESAVTYSEPVPAGLDHLARSKEQRAETAKVPKTLNNLFHKIMGWNDELSEMRRETALRGGVATVGASVPFGSEDGMEGLRPQLEPTSAMAKKEFQKMSEKLRYGALLEEYDKDQFALENKLSVAGMQFERKFTDWAAIRVVDNAAQQEMADMNQNKASMLLHADMDFKIPKLGHDCCKGCGSTMQDQNKDVYGYVKPGRVERYIQNHSEKVKARSEYGDRMAELHDHWAKHGRRVGEEWLDFMTQDEFNAVYKYVPRPMICDRCSVLNSKKSGLVSMTLMTAPDFAKELKPLREKKCLVVLVCDITDFPGSMVYDLPALISMNNPVILVLNKLDCIQVRRPGYKGAARAYANQIVSEAYIKQWAKEIATQFRLPAHRIKSIIPVSANRGWNVDRLIEDIEKYSNMNLARPEAPILPTYFAGVSNVGKSSLINSIAHKLYAPQPPHPLSKRLYYTKTDASGKESVHWRWYTPPNAHAAEMQVSKASSAEKRATNLLTVSNLPGTTIATTGIKMSLTGEDKGQSSTYFFDTPGLHPHWQATSPLSVLDVRRSLQYGFRNPEVYVIKQGATLLFGGIAAIDVVKANASVMFCVYSSRKTGHAIINTDRSDMFWAEQLGKKVGPPMSLEQIGDMRLSTKKSYLFECYGKHRMSPKADIYFCGLGWASFFTSAADDIVLRVRTLPGIVHGVREPLRINDIRARGKWPRIPSEARLGDQRIPRINKVIKLTNKEVNLEEAPIKRVERTEVKRHAVGSDKPFEEVMEELSALGKMQ